MRCEAQPRSPDKDIGINSARRTIRYIEQAPEVAIKQIVKRESPDKDKGGSVVNGS
jgi:hypothetical protein